MISLHYRRLGHGRIPIIMLHGLFGSGSNWLGIAQLLAATHDVWLVDLRNHGQSPWATPHTYSTMVADLAHHIPIWGLSNCHIVGHSMGGKVAMLALSQFPHLFRSGCIIDILPIEYPPSHLPIFEAMMRVASQPQATRSHVGEQLISHGVDPVVTSFLLKNWVKQGPGNGWGFNLTAILNDYASLMGYPPHQPMIPHPTTWIMGERSEYRRPNGIDIIRRHCTQAQEVMIPNAGHWVGWDAPEACFKAIQAAIAT